jgi:large subunit ribosomal protein L25
MEEILLDAESRDVIGKQVKALRRQGKLPGIIYGRGMQPTPILMDLRDASHTLGQLAPSALVTVVLAGEKHLTLVREKQRDFIRGTLKHVDFQAVSMKEKLRVNVIVDFVGLSPAVKDFNGVLVEGLTEVEVECFPQDLPGKITVDISGLNKIGDSITVKDLVMPPNVISLDNPDEMIIIVTAQAAEEVVEVAVVEVAEEVEPELIEKGKKEEEEEEENGKEKEKGKEA